MNCPACHQANPDDARFCSHCAAPLGAPARAPDQRPPDRPGIADRAAGAAAAQAAPPLGAWAAPNAALPGLVRRVLEITLRPKTEWPVIAAEPDSVPQIIVGCVLPLAAIQAVLAFVHMAVIGVGVPFLGTMRMPVLSSLSAALMGIVFALLGVFLLALIVNFWAPFFAARRNLGAALKVAAYAVVPGWLGSFFVVVPFLATLLALIGGLYALYVLYLGLPVVMRSAREKALGYTVAVVLSGMVAGILLGAVAAATGGLMHHAMHEPNPADAAQQGAAAAGNIVGGLLGTDDQGKAALGQALGNLARAGQQMEEARKAERANAADADAAAPASPARNARSARALGGDTAAAQDGEGAAPVAGTNPNPNANANAGDPSTNAGAAAANAGAAVGGLLNALGGALGGNRRVTPVDFRTLQTLLPESVAGLPRGATQGENRQAVGIKGSSAKATYAGAGGKRIHLTISDVSGVSGLIDIAGGLDHTTDAQTETGFERDATLAGRVVHEKFNTADRRGELQTIVGKRFNVELEGNGFEMPALEQALAQVDLARLESMKDQGARN